MWDLFQEWNANGMEKAGSFSYRHPPMPDWLEMLLLEQVEAIAWLHGLYVWIIPSEERWLVEIDPAFSTMKQPTKH
jgi:hypothetical protein